MGTLTVVNPADGHVIDELPTASPVDVAARVARLREAQQDWARRHPTDRATVLAAAAGRIDAARTRLVSLAVREGGRRWQDTEAGLDAAIGAFRQAAELGPLHGGRSLCGAVAALDLTIREPRGVVAVICPWNDPLAIAANGLAAGLATGNCVAVKPSEHTPMATAAMLEAAALPDGVATAVTGGPEAGAALVELADAVVFTGSVDAGRTVAARCGARLVPAVLELGGKDPLVVDAGVDPEWAAAMAASGAFVNAGQVCTSVERVYVHREIAEAFVAALVARSQALRLGDPLARDTDLGPMINRRQRALVEGQVAQAVAAGARVLAGGTTPPSEGAYYPPTVLVDVPDEVDLMCRETFGPVAAIRVVDSFEAGLRHAAAGDYGLAATVLTPAIEHATMAVRRLPVGTVKVNDVWGGAPGGSAEPRAASGLGLGYGPGLYDELTAVKVAHIAPATINGRGAT